MLNVDMKHPTAGLTMYHAANRIRTSWTLKDAIAFSGEMLGEFRTDAGPDITG
jgi:hypothetical protein